MRFGSHSRRRLPSRSPFDAACASAAAALAMALMVAAAPAAAMPLDACATVPGQVPQGETVHVARILSGDTLALADGRVIRLAGISIPRSLNDPTADRAAPARDVASEATAALNGLLAGRALTLLPVASEPDRHGRLRARLTRADDDLWVEAELVAAGIARVEPGPDDVACARALQAVEAEARDAKRGFWAEPRFRVLAANDPELKRWLGRYVLVEGKVISTGQSGTRHYLNFGTDFRRDFAVLLDDKVGAEGRKDRKYAGRFAAAGLYSNDIVGHVVRVRGVLVLGGGGLIRPSLPEEIEWVSSKP